MASGYYNPILTFENVVFRYAAFWFTRKKSDESLFFCLQRVHIVPFFDGVAIPDRLRKPLCSQASDGVSGLSVPQS